jgi:uncharacterized protein YqgQ
MREREIEIMCECVSEMYNHEMFIEKYIKNV